MSFLEREKTILEKYEKENKLNENGKKRLAEIRRSDKTYEELESEIQALKSELEEYRAALEAINGIRRQDAMKYTPGDMRGSYGLLQDIAQEVLSKFPRGSK